MFYDDMCIIFFIGCLWYGFDCVLIECIFKMGIFIDCEYMFVIIVSWMLDYGYNDYIMYIGEYLGYLIKELICWMMFEEVVVEIFEYFNCLILIIGDGL